MCATTLVFSGDSTVDHYVSHMSVTPSNLNSVVDDLINEYLVYDCPACGHSHKYTSKEIEKLLRKNLTERALVYIIRNMTENDNLFTYSYFIYCSKCQGLDGKGSCPKTIYDQCQIKRFPVDVL